MPIRTRTLGFLFSDLRGYTELIDREGDGAASDIVRAYRRIAREAIASHGATEIGTEGDSFFVIFDSVVSAVECGADILRETGAHDPPIRVGVGIHAGEAAEGDLGYVAGPVNLAARLCAQARAGDILVSDTVRALTRTALELRFESVGAKRLKGFEEPVALWRIEVKGAARATDHGLLPRWLLLAMIAAFIPAIGVAAYQGYGMATGRFAAIMPRDLFPFLAAFAILYVVSDLLATFAVAMRTDASPRVAARTLCLNAVLTAAFIPIATVDITSAGGNAVGDVFLGAFGLLSMAAFLAWPYGLYRRRQWAVGLGYAVCGVFALAMTPLPLAIAAAAALHRRRENALY